MFGIILVAVAETFAEAATSIGKYKVMRKKESFYGLGFLNAIWATVFLLIIVFFKQDELIFSLASLPTFLLRALLEIILLFVSLHALVSADRSTFSFLRMLTIPLLLFVDIIMGYSISIPQIVGISTIFITLLFLFNNHTLSKQGKTLSLISAVLAVGTIALYKYNITYYNSVAAEQIIMHLILVLVLIVGARLRTGENVFKYLTHRVFLFQSLASGVASVFLSFAYLFAPASIILTTKRTFEMLFSIVSGCVFFKERHVFVKFITFLFILLGIIFMMF